MRRGEVLVDLDCSAVHRLSLRDGLPRAAASQFARVQPGLVRLEVCGTALAQPPLLALGQLDRQCTHDLLHHLVLGAKISVRSRSNRSAQRCPPLAASMSCAVMRTRLPALRMPPSSTKRTPRSRPMSCTLTDLPL